MSINTIVKNSTEHLNQEIPLNDFITLQRGFDLPSRERIEGDVPVVASTGISSFHNMAKVKAPGVVIGRSGSIGGGQYITEDFWPLNTTLWVKDFKNHHPRFIYYLLKNIDFTSFNAGAAVPTLNRNHLSSIKIKPFPYEYEERISKILGDLDDKIQLNQQINQTLEEMAQALFKSWFVDFEPTKAKIEALKAGGNEEDANLAAMQAISGKTAAELEQLKTQNPENYQQLYTTAQHFPATMQESELGEIPEGWSVLPLYDTAEYINGSAFKAKDFSSNQTGLPIIKISELKQGVSSTTKFTAKTVDDKYLIQDGSILYSWSGSPETSLEVFKWFGGKGWLNQHIFKLNFSGSQNKYFTYFLLKKLKPLLVSTAKQKQTTGLGHITIADMKRIKVTYPDSLVMACFSMLIAPIYEQSSVVSRESTSLALLRDTLLPKLLSGEVSTNGMQ